MWKKIRLMLAKVATGSMQKLEWMDESKFERIKTIPNEEILSTQWKNLM